MTKPAAFAGAAPELTHNHRFRRMLRLGGIWRASRLVLWFAERLGYAWGDDPPVARAAVRARVGLAGWEPPVNPMLSLT